MRSCLLISLALGFSACGAKPPAKKPLPSDSQADGNAVMVDGRSPFALACNESARTGAYGDSLDEAFTILCADDLKPSGTFVKTLAGNPWDGDSGLKIFRIGSPEHDNLARTTKLTGGGTVIIPIDAHKFAEMSLLYAANPELAVDHGIKLVDGLRSETKLDENMGSGDGVLLGRVTSRLLIEKVINHQRIVIEYDAVRSSARFSPDVFVTATKLSRPIQGIKDMYSVSLAYPWEGVVAVTTLIMTKTDNKNQPGVAAEALLKTFREGIQNIRTNAVVMGLRESELWMHAPDAWDDLFDWEHRDD